MKADDPRHGSVAGRRRHQREGSAVCDDCRAAHNAQEADRKRRAKGPRQPRRLRWYADSGYSPNDGLKGGQWVRDGLIWRWESDDEVAA